MENWNGSRGGGEKEDKGGREGEKCREKGLKEGEMGVVMGREVIVKYLKRAEEEKTNQLATVGFFCQQLISHNSQSTAKRLITVALGKYTQSPLDTLHLDWDVLIFNIATS